MPTRRSGKVSIVDVAKLAGISTATAGRVLGGYGYASDEIRDKVQKAATSLGYRPNLLARGLITGRTHTIGVVAADIESPFYASAIRGISDVARSRGFGVIVTNSDENLDLEKDAVQLLLEKQVDGIIVSPSNLKKPKHLVNAIASGCPVVQIDRIAKGIAADSVTVDNIAAARQCVERLIRAGHRRIGFLAELASSYAGDVASFVAQFAQTPADARHLYPSWQRLAGYLQAHAQDGLPVDLKLIRRVGAYSAAAGKSETLALLQGARPPTALFTGDGTMSIGAMEAITELGLDVPGDLSLVCFDDLEWMKFSGSGITAASQPMREIGRAAAEILLDRIGGASGPPRSLMLPVQLIERRSVGAPAVRPTKAAIGA